MQTDQRQSDRVLAKRCSPGDERETKDVILTIDNVVLQIISIEHNFDFHRRNETILQARGRVPIEVSSEEQLFLAAIGCLPEERQML
jgi:hypothetical protein